MLEKAEKGQGLALKLSSLGLVKYQQPMKYTHGGIGILPPLIVKYLTKRFYNFVIPLYLGCHIVVPLYLAYL